MLFTKRETGNGLFFIWKAIYKYKIFHTYGRRERKEARKIYEQRDQTETAVLQGLRYSC